MNPFPGLTLVACLCYLHKEVMFSLCLFVCLQDYAKSTRPIFTNFGGMVAHVQRKKQLDFGGNRIGIQIQEFLTEFPPVLWTTSILRIGWLCLTNANYTCDCRELSASIVAIK